MSLFLANCGVIAKASPPIPFEAFSDDFEDGSMNAWWREGVSTFAAASIDPAVTIVESGGVLTMTPLSSTSGSHFNGWESNATHNLTGRTIGIEIIPDAGTSNANVRFAFGEDENNYASFIIISGSVFYRVRAGGSNSDTSTSHDINAYRWLRFRHSGSSLFFESAPDNSTWTTRRTVSTPSFGMTTSRVCVFVGTTSSTTPGTPVFDNFSVE